MSGVEITLNGVDVDAHPMEFGDGETGLLLTFREPQSGVSIAFPITTEEARDLADILEPDDG